MGHERKRRQKKRKFHGNFRTAQKKIFDIEILMSIFSILSSPVCYNQELYLIEDSRFGLQSNLCLKFFGMRVIGKGFSAGKKLFSMLNIPYPSKCTYRQHEIKLLHAASQAANNSILESAKSITECSNECGVSVDGFLKGLKQTAVFDIRLTTGMGIQRRSIMGDIYGYDSIVKYECIGHVQKRVGSRLRKLKKSTKGLGGKGKLTDKFIDTLQNDFGIAIRSNVGNLSNMQTAVIAAFLHCCSTDKKPMHGQCPSGSDTWCKYQKAKQEENCINIEQLAYQMLY
ncbi:uncharacterized protein TNCV_1619581 [Trichonephila clavipes]|nr:uncharacterized protein TNCV_1619581 [Trichonephila clavipes]